MDLLLPGFNTQDTFRMGLTFLVTCTTLDQREEVDIFHTSLVCVYLG